MKQPLSRLVEQPELLPTSGGMPGDYFAEESHETCGVFTAERFFQQRPAEYRMAVALLAEGMGLIRIGRVLRVSAHTVAAVRDREGISVAIEKERIAATALRGAAMAVEAVVDDLADPYTRAKVPTLQKAMIHGILIDKAQLLRGEATMIIETHEIKEPDHNAFQAYIDGLRSANQPVEVGGNGAKKAGVRGAISGGEARPGGNGASGGVEGGS